MSIITGKGFLVSYAETDLECPICSCHFDASDKMDKAKNPYFKMKCPGCKTKIGVLIPIFGGTTKCFELDVPPSVKALETEAPFKVNDKIQ